MRVIDIQAQMRRVGVIRLGEQAPASGNMPGKRLSTFRLTSNDQHALRVVAQKYGGSVVPWASGSQSWQIVTRASELPIEIGPIPATTAYEYWAQVGGKGSKQCIRRCDGCTIHEGVERGGSCICPADPIERAAASKQKGSKVCSLVCRLFVRLPEVPDVGLWQVTTGSFYAAREVPAIMDGIEALAQMGAHIRARLAIDVRRGGGKTFPVLAVRLTQTNDELRALAVDHFEKMKALDGADKMAQVAFKLGLPMTVADGRIIRTIQDVPAELNGNARALPESNGGQDSYGQEIMGDWGDLTGDRDE